MVQEALRRLNEENENLDNIIGNIPVHQVSDAFDLTFGKECNFFAGEPYATFNTAPEEKKREFIERLKGTYVDNTPGIELDFDPNQL
jgi:hypothetical protein